MQIIIFSPVSTKSSTPCIRQSYFLKYSTANEPSLQPCESNLQGAKSTVNMRVSIENENDAFDIDPIGGATANVDRRRSSAPNLVPAFAENATVSNLPILSSLLRDNSWNSDSRVSTSSSTDCEVGLRRHKKLEPRSTML